MGLIKETQDQSLAGSCKITPGLLLVHWGEQIPALITLTEIMRLAAGGNKSFTPIEVHEVFTQKQLILV